MKKNIKIFLILSMLFFIMIVLSGCSNNISDDDTKTKASEELEYLDNKIISILNKLNNISLENYTITSEEITLEESSSSQSSGDSETNEQQNQSDNDSKSNNVTITQMEQESILNSSNDIDWDSIKGEIEIINETWGVVILDLTNLNVDNNTILEFSSTLDDCILSIKDEDKITSLTNLAKLYSYIPEFEKGILSDNGTQNLKQVKSYIISAYSYVEQNDWSIINTNISNAEGTFINLINDVDYMSNKEYKVNKIYVLLEELKNSLSYKDKDLFYVKYKNLMESINTL